MAIYSWSYIFIFSMKSHTDLKKKENHMSISVHYTGLHSVYLLRESKRDRLVTPFYLFTFDRHTPSVARNRNRQQQWIVAIIVEKIDNSRVYTICDGMYVVMLSIVNTRVLKLKKRVLMVTWREHWVKPRDNEGVAVTLPKKFFLHDLCWKNPLGLFSAAVAWYKQFHELGEANVWNTLSC